MIIADINANKLNSADIVTTYNVKFSGINHEPSINESWVLLDTKAIKFQGPSSYLDKAEQYLLSVFTCTDTTWKEWSVYVVVQTNEIPSVESILLSVNQNLIGTFPGTGETADRYPLVLLYATSTNFGVNILSDDLTSSDSTVFGSIDNDTHLLEIHADGVGSVDAFFDGTYVTSIDDQRPKTSGSTMIGAGFYVDPSYILEQFNGSIPRIVIAKDLSPGDKSKIRDQLLSIYDIT